MSIKPYLLERTHSGIVLGSLSFYGCLVDIIEFSSGTIEGLKEGGDQSFKIFLDLVSVLLTSCSVELLNHEAHFLEHLGFSFVGFGLEQLSCCLLCLLGIVEIGGSLSASILSGVHSRDHEVVCDFLKSNNINVEYIGANNVLLSGLAGL